MVEGLLELLRLAPRTVTAGLGRMLPSACALCSGTSDAAVCLACRQRYAPSRRRCTRCAVPLAGATGDGTLCGKCIGDPPAFDATVAAADYAAPVDQLVLALKFGGRLALAPLFAAMLREAVTARPADELPAVLTAVPIGAARLAERGFNQALEIARPLSRSLNIPLWVRLAVRHRETRPQSVLLPDERRSNLRGAFVVPQHACDRIQGMHVGVVDDVMTTGETLDELARTLKRFGAARVTNLVFARTMPK